MNMNEASSTMGLEKSWVEFPGHMAPATAFTFLGSYALLRSFRLYKELPLGRTFAQTHIPYRNLPVVRNVGLFAMTVTTAGAIYHSLGEGIDTSILVHMTLYACFFMTGLAAFLESQKRLVPDSGRAALALSYFLTGFVWRAHGMMNMVPVTRNVHVYMGHLCFVSGAVTTYSVIRNDSILAHIICWGCMVLQGLWLYVIAFYLCCIELDESIVEACLCLVVIFVAIVIFLVIGCSNLPQVRGSHSTGGTVVMDGRGDYEVLAKFHDNNTHDLVSTGSQGTVETQESGDDAC
jgi:hypothetical protein